MFFDVKIISKKRKQFFFFLKRRVLFVVGSQVKRVEDLLVEGLLVSMKICE